MSVSETFLSVYFRVADSVPAAFTCSRVRFCRYSCVCDYCLRLVLLCDGGRYVCICDAHLDAYVFERHFVYSPDAMCMD